MLFSSEPPGFSNPNILGRWLRRWIAIAYTELWLNQDGQPLFTNYFSIDALGFIAGALVFAVFLLPPGYLFAFATDLADFRASSPSLQILWSISLSMPISLLVAAVLGRYISTKHTLTIFGLMALVAIVHVFFRLRRSTLQLRTDRFSRAVILSMLALAAYLIVATSSIQVGHRLFESVNSSDWSVRIPLVGAALRNGVPPGNPLFAYQGHAEASRYYFYWYALVAQVSRLGALSARASLSASVLWSAFGLVSVIFLYL